MLNIMKKIKLTYNAPIYKKSIMMNEDININVETSIFKGEFQFLNSNDFKGLYDRLLCDGDENIVRIGNKVFIKFDGDLSDLGNEIGINVGEYINKDNLGYERGDLISGINHGISLIDGTHG